MKKLYLLIFLSIISGTAFGQFYYYPLGANAPYSVGGIPVKQNVCVGTTNTATTVSVSMCGTPTSTLLTLTPKWYLNNALVYTGASFPSSTGGAITITLPAGSFTYTTAGNYYGVNGLRCDLTLSSGMSAFCGSAGALVVGGLPDSIVVNPNPAAITGTNTVCPTFTKTLSDVTVGGTWSSSATGIATVGTSGIVTGVASGTSIITYSVNGCFVTRIVTVSAVPTAYTVTGGGSYCPGGSGVAVGLSLSNSGINYQLYNGAATVGGTVAGTGAGLNFGLQTAGTYTVKATSSTTGCINGMTGSVTVSLSPTVTPSVSISPTSALICAGVMNTFTSVPVNGGTAPTYQWSVNGTPVGTSSSYSYLPSNGDVVSVVLTAAGGVCPVPATATSSYTVAVTSSAMPTITTSVTPGTHICLGSTAMFTATSTFGGTTPVYRWNRNGINVATGPTYYYLPANGDVIYCLLYSSYPCRLADSIASSTTIMNVETPAAAPTVSIIANPGLNIGVGQTDTLIAVAAGGSATHTYQWMINAVPVAGATSAMFINNTYANNDMVTCKVTNTDYCALATNKTVIVNVGTLGIEGASYNGMNLNLYPNPNNGTFYITGAMNGAREATIEISDLLGRTIYKNSTAIQNDQLNEQLVLNNIASGIYILNVRTAATNNKIRFSISK